MKKPFFARFGLPILMVVFFLVPFALRGARMAVQRMKNDVKDWLPSDFAETRQLDWFRDHFLGEQFVVLSWDQCTGANDDEHFKAFIDHFFPEKAPSRRTGEAIPQTREFMDEDLGLYVRQMEPRTSDGEEPFIGDSLGLWSTGDYHQNWGGKDEKWLRTSDEQWVYLTPQGELYLWRDNNSLVASALRSMQRMITGPGELTGEYLKAFPEEDADWYYENPRRLTAQLFKSVTTGPGALKRLIAPNILDNDVDTAKRRLTGSLFGPDGNQTCLIVTLTEHGKADLPRALGRGILGKPRGVLLDMAEQAGIHPPPPPTLVPPPISWFVARPLEIAPSLRMGGPSVDNVAIDEEGQITLVRLVGLSAVLGLVLAWISFRSVNITWMVFFVGTMSAVISLAIVWWADSSVDAVLMSMPSLVYVLGLSGAVHIVNYYREEVLEGGHSGAAERALKIGWRPCLLAAFTTSLGLMSLVWSEILPIRKFGALSAAGVMATLVLLFTYLPAALSVSPPRQFRQRRGGTSDADRFTQLVESMWMAVCRFVIRRHRAVSIIFLVFLVAVAAGATKINTSIQLLKMFDADAKIIRDYRWLEANLGKLVPMELVVRVKPDAMRVAEFEESDARKKADAPPQGDSTASTYPEDKFRLSFLERMEIGHYIEQFVMHRFGENGKKLVGPAMLTSTFAPELPDRTKRWRGGFSRSMLDHRDDFLELDYLRLDKENESELWRVSLRLGALQNIDYGGFVSDLQQTIEPLMAAYAYREQVLRCIDAQNHGEGYRGKHVYLLGFPGGPSRSAKKPLADAGTQPADPQVLSSDEQQTQDFCWMLAQLLKTANVQVDWHDPSFEVPEDFAGMLEQQDCVVVITNENDYDSSLLQQNQLRLIDARQHRFAPHSGQLTAEAIDAPVSVVYTGLVPVVYKAQRTLLENLIQSTAGAFIMIAIVMILLLKNIRAGLLSMLPNVFPVAIVFGFMGWAGILVDIGSMMTASVAMGVAVDDTIHFLTWFRRGLEQGLDRTKAIELAYRRVATAMTQTTLIGGLGLSIFSLSTFTPTQRFGTLMLALLALALVGDLIFLPALLASPLGSVFRKRQGPQQPKEGDSPDDGDQTILAMPPRHVPQAHHVPGQRHHEDALDGS